jgi:glycosyltransferase involved in cell wall biosynthesis
MTHTRNCEPTFTVFTATYNRAATLPRLWRSLTDQTFRDFEWVVVDDGSTDGTAELVAGWVSQSAFPIRYFYQERGHKKTAFNTGVREAKGYLLATLDSDDEYKCKALERFWWHWNNIPRYKREQFTGVTGLCAYPHGGIVGSRFRTENHLDSDNIEIHRRWKVTGDKCGCQRVDILRKFPFPEDVSGFVPEGVVWAQIATQYKTRYINEVLAMVHTEDQTGAVRLSAEADPAADAPGMLLWAESVFKHQWRYLFADPIYFIYWAVNFTRFNLHNGTFSLPFDGGLPGYGLRLATMPAGYMAYMVDLWKRNHRHEQVAQALARAAR